MDAELEFKQEGALGGGRALLSIELISTGRHSASAGHYSSTDRSPSLQSTRAWKHCTRAGSRFTVGRWTTTNPIGEPARGDFKGQGQGFAAVHPGKGAARLQQRDRLNRELGAAAQLAHRQASRFPGCGDAESHACVRDLGRPLGGLRIWGRGQGALPADFLAEELLAVVAKRQPAGGDAQGGGEFFDCINAGHPLPALNGFGNAPTASEDAQAVVAQAGSLARALQARRQAEPERVFLTTSHAA